MPKILHTSGQVFVPLRRLAGHTMKALASFISQLRKTYAHLKGILIVEALSSKDLTSP